MKQLILILTILLTILGANTVGSLYTNDIHPIKHSGCKHLVGTHMAFDLYNSQILQAKLKYYIELQKSFDNLLKISGGQQEQILTLEGDLLRLKKTRRIWTITSAAVGFTGGLLLYSKLGN